jgi:hypothetical protein
LPWGSGAASGTASGAASGAAMGAAMADATKARNASVNFMLLLLSLRVDGDS